MITLYLFLYYFDNYISTYLGFLYVLVYAFKNVIWEMGGPLVIRPPQQYMVQKKECLLYGKE